jgi:hypothetical protein
MNIYEQLVKDGWKEYPNQFRSYSRSFYKKFETPTRCFGNDDRPGIQIEIAVGEHNGQISMEIELCAGVKDETWFKIQNYAVPNTLERAVLLIPRMLAAWELVANFYVRPTA